MASQSAPVQLAFLDVEPRRKEERDPVDSFGKLWTWANNPEPIDEFYFELAADVRALWNKYAADERRLKSLDAEAEIAANHRKASGKLATDYGGRVRELEFEITRLEGKLAAANMPLRLAALLAAVTVLAITLAVVL